MSRNSIHASGVECDRLEKPGARRVDCDANLGPLVCCEIVHHHDVAGPECRHEDLGHVSLERQTIHGAVENHRRDHAGRPERADEGRRLPMTMRERCDTALAVGRTAIKPRHLGRGSGLVDEHQPVDVDLRLRCFPRHAFSGYVRPILLAGV